MILTEELSLKHILKTRQINQSQKKIYLENLLIKRGFSPKKNHNTDEINKKIAHIKTPKYSNLSKGEQKALKDLKLRDDIVIVNVDKRGALVIMDLTDYIKKIAVGC